ncbi:hypothetical protein IH575_00150 [Candidatus Dojkabacteria bacterium]|nr:hypothetical protein [Candidatus Dojkabacteria bacterium]
MNLFKRIFGSKVPEKKITPPDGGQKKRDSEGYLLCEKCGHRALAKWTCPECKKVFCVVCCGQSPKDSRKIKIFPGGFQMETLKVGFDTPKCPYCDA